MNNKIRVHESRAPLWRRAQKGGKGKARGKGTLLGKDRKQPLYISGCLTKLTQQLEQVVANSRTSRAHESVHFLFVLDSEGKRRQATPRDVSMPWKDARFLVTKLTGRRGLTAVETGKDASEREIKTQNEQGRAPLAVGYTPPPNYWEMSETETTFDDLQGYAVAQNMAIQTLYKVNPEDSNPVFIQSKFPAWNAVWKATWKKGENTFRTTVEVQRDDNHFDDTLLSETVPVRCNIAVLPDGLADAWGFNCKSLFIRQDYEEALRAVLWGCSYEGSAPYDTVICSGSPGIGKSGFLVLLLLWRLAAGLPTGLQIHYHYTLLFWEGGVLEFCEPDIRTYYTTLGGTGDPRSRIWMLVDSNQNLTQPSGAFSDCGPFFVVFAASPRRERLQWTMRTISFFFYMKPWSFSEVLQARTLFMRNNPPSEHDLWALYSDYRPSPRDLFSRTMCPEMYIKLVQAELAMLSPELERRLLEDPNLASDASDLLVLIEPLPTSRFVSNRRIVTDHVSQLLLQKRRHTESPGPVIGRTSRKRKSLNPFPISIFSSTLFIFPRTIRCVFKHCCCLFSRVRNWLLVQYVFPFIVQSIRAMEPFIMTSGNRSTRQ